MDRFTTFAAEVEEDGLSSGIIKGTAMTYGVPIKRGEGLYEQVQAGAFRKQTAVPNRVIVLSNHDTDKPIGRATSFDDNDERLRFEAQLSHHEDLPDARKALALLKEGIVDEISVGFGWQTWSEQRDEDTGSTTILHTKAHLREFSVVTFGALGRDARVLSVAMDGIVPVNTAAYRARLERLGA